MEASPNAVGERRRLGALRVPSLALGCSNFGRRLDAEESAAVVHASLASGVDLFDTADTYSEGASEEFLGRALRGMRERALIATKFGGGHGSARLGAAPDAVRRALDASLRRLGTDYVDLYQCHWPDPAVPWADTLGALQECVDAGKVREIGHSNLTASEIDEADRAARSIGSSRFVSAQNEYSLLRRSVEHDLMATCERLGIGVMAYAPLARGLLTGKYRSTQAPPQGTRLAVIPPETRARMFEERDLGVVRSLHGFAAERGRTLLELALSWIVRRSGVASAIVGAMSPEQLRANVAATSWDLSTDEMRTIDELTSGDA